MIFGQRGLFMTVRLKLYDSSIMDIKAWDRVHDFRATWTLYDSSIETL